MAQTCQAEEGLRLAGPFHSLPCIAVLHSLLGIPPCTASAQRSSSCLWAGPPSAVHRTCSGNTPPSALITLPLHSSWQDGPPPTPPHALTPSLRTPCSQLESSNQNTHSECNTLKTQEKKTPKKHKIKSKRNAHKTHNQKEIPPKNAPFHRKDKK
jgi:hypothetical protein